jgi:hypothetical protein
MVRNPNLKVIVPPTSPHPHSDQEESSKSWVLEHHTLSLQPPGRERRGRVWLVPVARVTVLWVRSRISGTRSARR